MNHSTGSILLSKSFLLSFFSFFFLWVSFDFFILFPLFILKAGGDSVDVGIQTAVFYIPSVFIRPLAGWFIDRTGRLKSLWLGSFLMAVTAAAFIPLVGIEYQRSQYLIGAILFLRGTAFAAFYTAFFTYVADLTTTLNRARILGLFGVSGLFAHGISPWSGELILEAFSFRGFFFSSAALAMVSLCISAFMREQYVLPTGKHGGVDLVKRLTFSKRNLIVLPGAFVFGYVIASFNTFGAPYFESIGGARVGYFFLVYGGTAGFVRIFLGGIADRFARWKVVAIFFAVQGLGAAFIVLPPVQYFYLIGAAACGLAHGILFPCMTAMAIDAHEGQFRGIVTSVFTGTIELGFSLGSYFLGILVAVLGYRAMFLSGLFVALAFVLYVVALQTRRQ